jgi:hypothetical protein
MGNRSKLARDALNALGRAMCELILIVVTTIALFLRLILVALTNAFQILCRFSQPLVWAMFAIAEVLAAFWVFPLVVQAYTLYDMDFAAYIPAIIIVVLPPIMAFGSGYGWNALLASAIATVIIGGLIVAGGMLVQTVVICGILAGLCFYKIQQQEAENET